jgi:hypothetical protein
MAPELHLHICHKCQVVHAGRSISGPQVCGSCGNHGLSKIDMRELFGEDVQFADD